MNLSSIDLLSSTHVLSLSGSPNEYLSSSSINLSGESFTIEIWLKRYETGSQWFLSQGSSKTQNGLFSMGFTNDAFTCSFYSNDIISDESYPQLDEWFVFSSILSIFILSISILSYLCSEDIVTLP